MVRNTNLIVEVGNLCRNMDVSYTSKGTAIGSFAIAVNDITKKGEEYVPSVSFFEVRLFGKITESLQPFLKKGVKVCVTGSLHQNRWEKDGKKYSAIEIRASSVELLSSAKSDGQDGQKSDAEAEQPPMEDYEPLPDDERVPF